MPLCYEKMLKKILFSLIITVPLLFLGKHLYDKQQRTEYIEKVAPLVKNSSIRVSNALKIEIDSSNVTFAELFEKLEEDTKEIEKRNIEVQSAAVQKFKDISDPTIAYLEACQSYSRAMAMMYRKKLALQNSMDAADDAIADARGTSSYSFDYAKKRASRAMEKMDEAIKERVASASDFHLAAKNLKEKRLSLSSVLEGDALIDLAQLDKVIKSSGQLLDEMKKAAETRT